MHTTPKTAPAAPRRSEGAALRRINRRGGFGSGCDASKSAKDVFAALCSGGAHLEDGLESLHVRLDIRVCVAQDHLVIGHAVVRKQVQMCLVGRRVDPNAPIRDEDGRIELLNCRALCGAWRLCLGGRAEHALGSVPRAHTWTRPSSGYGFKTMVPSARTSYLPCWKRSFAPGHIGLVATAAG